MSSSKSSYNAFKSVDELVSKPVIGSDGAASWQDFQKDTKHISTANVAPHLPIKKVDRLGGITSLQEERKREEELRKESGKSGESQGYTVFKKKNQAEEAAARKKRKRIEDRIRPDDKKYFIPSETFDGSKFDYVFTTRDRGTGYYWDGMDSVKRLKSGGDVDGDVVNDDVNAATTETTTQVDKPKRKQKKKKQASAPIIVDDPNNPMEQVAEAIRRRNESLNATPSALLGLPSGWEVARDESSGKSYYYCRATGQRQWEKPTAPAASTKALEVTNTAPLPEGWSVAKDASTGKEYYYNSKGETKWERPT